MNDSIRVIEIYSAGCPICDAAVAEIKAASCPSCDIKVLDMNDPEVSKRATVLEIASVPAVVIDGKLAECCATGAVNIDTLRAAGLGRPLP